MTWKDRRSQTSSKGILGRVASSNPQVPASHSAVTGRLLGWEHDWSCLGWNLFIKNTKEATRSEWRPVDSFFWQYINVPVGDSLSMILQYWLKLNNIELFISSLKVHLTAIATLPFPIENCFIFPAVTSLQSFSASQASTLWLGPKFGSCNDSRPYIWTQHVQCLPSLFSLITLDRKDRFRLSWLVHDCYSLYKLFHVMTFHFRCIQSS